MAKKKKERLMFEQLYDRYEQKIYYCAYGVLQQKEQAEDVTQDIFEQLYQTQQEWQSFDETHLTKYLLRITKNKAIDVYRRNNTQVHYLKDYQDGKESFDSPIDESLITEELVEELVATLKEPYRKVFMYRVFYGLSFKETADLLFSREDTVRKQYERARLKLKAVLGGNNYEEAK